MHVYVVIPPIDLLCVCVYRITGAALSYTKRVRGKSHTHTHTHKTPAYMHSVCVCARIAIAYWLLGVVVVVVVALVYRSGIGRWLRYSWAMNERGGRRECRAWLTGWRREADEEQKPSLPTSFLSLLYPWVGFRWEEGGKRERERGKRRDRETLRDSSHTKRL